MRINQFIARATGISRRGADEAISRGRVTLNGHIAKLGDRAEHSDRVALDSKVVTLKQTTTIMLNKPVGYVCSRDGQGSKTVYDLIPKDLHNLKPVGRLDKDSSGLLLLTNDGELANLMSHPSNIKQKVYEVELDKNLSTSDQSSIKNGVLLEDGMSKLRLEDDGKNWIVTMHEGRNRQIRRTFGALKYKVIKLHRTNFGDYSLTNLPEGEYKIM